MALLVGEIQANITADASKYAQELDKARAADRGFRSNAEKPVEINGDGKPALTEIGRVDSAVTALAKTDRAVTVRADDKASPVIRQVAGEDVADKNVAITADDKASAKIDRVKTVTIPDKQVAVELDDQTGPGTQRIGANLTKWAAGLGLGALIGKGLEKGLELGDARTSLQNQMGTIAADAKRYGEEAGDVFAEGFAESREQVNEAMSAASSNFANFAQMSSDAREQVVGDGVKIANVFGEEVSPVMAAAGSLVANKVAPDIQSAMDTITAGLQNAANKGDDILDTFTEYSPFFHRMGLDSAEALGFMNQAILNGARNSDIAADAIKEFSLRAIDGSTQTADGFSQLGLSAEDMSAKIAAGGTSAHDAFLLTLKSLQDMDDPLQRNIIGVELFGTQWEDALRDALPGMDLTKLKMDGIAGSADRLQQTSGQWLDSLTRGLGNAIPVISQATLALAALPAVASMLGGGFAFAKDKIGGLVSGLAASHPGLLAWGSGARSAAAGAEGAASSGGRLAGIMSKVGGGLTFVGAAAIPAAAAFALVGTAWMMAAQHEQDLIDKGDALGTGLAKGGDEAKKAATEINKLNSEIAGAQRALVDLASQHVGPGAGYQGAYSGGSGANMGKQQQIQSGIADNLTVINEATKKYNELKQQLGEVGMAQAEYNAAVIASGPNSEAAAAAQRHLADVTSQQAQAQSDAADAAKTNTQALYDQQQQILASLSGVYSYEASLMSLDQAHASTAEAEGNLAKLEKDRHASKKDLAAASREVEAATLAENQAVLQSMNAFVQQRVAESGATTEQEKQKVALYATNEAAVTLAARYKGTLPEALRKTIGAMDATQLAAAGCTVTTDRLGNKIVTLPNGKKIKLTAEDQASPTINGVKNDLNGLHNKRITVSVQADMSGLYHSLDAAGQRFGVPFYASGTDYHPGGLAVVGENGPELVNLPRGSQVIDANKTKDMRTRGATVHSSNSNSTAVDRSRHAVYNINGIGLHEVVRALKDREREEELLYG